MLHENTKRNEPELHEETTVQRMMSSLSFENLEQPRSLVRFQAQRFVWTHVGWGTLHIPRLGRWHDHGISGSRCLCQELDDLVS